MEFDKLISNGQLTKAARLFAKEYYDSGRMGNTRRLLIERLADKCDKYDAEIDRQSVKSEEVAEAIERLEKWRASKYAWTVASAPCGKNIDLAITALQAYQPTTRKDRTVEEVAISKTETTGARALSCWYCTEMEKHGVVAVKTVLDKAGRKLDAYETPYNYCPNCGRRLD